MEKEKIERKIIPEDVKIEMVRLYTSGEVTSKVVLGKMFGTSKHKVNDVFNELGVFTVQSSERNKIVSVVDGPKYVATEEYTFIAKHKETGKEIKDFNNTSGALISYLQEINPYLDIPTKALRVTYYKKNGNYWYEQFYDIIKVPIVVKKMKGELYNSEIKEIIRLYSTGENDSTHRLGELFKVGHRKIAKILEDNNVEINSRGGQVKEFRKERAPEVKLPIKYFEKEGFEYKAVCNKTNFIFKDYLNISGALTRYLLTIHPNIKVPSDKCKKKYFLKHNAYWYEQYFKIKSFTKEETRKCDYCDWEMPIDVSARQYKMHLTMQHNIDIRMHLDKHPKDNMLFVDDFEKFEIEKDEDYWAYCAICGEKFKVITGTHLKSHNISLLDYKLKYNGPTVGLNIHNSLSIRSINTNMNWSSKRTKKSKPEKDIFKLITDLGFYCKVNDRSIIGQRKVTGSREIDILVVDKKFGIEYNGNLWHTEGGRGNKDKKYHLDKTERANLSGYGLIHIHDDEWLGKNKIVISKFKHMLGANDDLLKISGRKCKIESVTNDIVEIFINANSVSGVDLNYNISMGAFYNGSLIAVMTFLVIDENKSEYKMVDFVSNNDYVCQGVGGKLLNDFIKNFKPKNIISFGDRRWILDGKNNFLTKIGFKLVDFTEPDFKYYKNVGKNERVDKTRFIRKDLLKNEELIHKKEFSPDLDNDKLIKMLGFCKIWDCGLFKYELKL